MHEITAHAHDEERVQHTAEVLRGLGATLTARLYPGLGHTVNPDEIEMVRSMLAQVLGGGA